MKKRLGPCRKRASSLIITLLVVTILTVIVIAFLQSMSIERKTALSYSSVAKARLAAEAGAEEAMTTMRGLFLSYPDSATAWVTNMAPSASSNQTPGTAFYYYQTVSVTNSSTAPVNNLFFRPLVSGATNVPLANRGNAFAGVANLTNWININSSNLMDGRAWIGRPPGSANDPRIEIPWVNIVDGTNVVARYAYWIEDESFRVNLNVATNVLRGSVSMGTNTSEIPIQGVLRSVVASDSARGTLATNITQLRQTLPFGGDLKSLKNINYASAAYTNLSDTIGYISTIHSSGLNISRTGARRVNLNAIVSTNTSPASATTIRGELDRIITTITNQIPQFGQRFYRAGVAPTSSSAVSSSDQLTYVTRIAANIRDFIDQDSIPTQVQLAGTIYSGKPAFPLGGVPAAFFSVNPFRAVGKENVPRLVEVVMRAPQLTAMTTGSTSPYNIRISYYMEFWNMGTKDITVDDLCSFPGADDAFIRIGNQPEWINKTANGNFQKIPPNRPYEIKLSNFRDGANNPLVFRAGQMTVLTTDPTVQTSPINSSWRSQWSVGLAGIYRPASNLDAYQRYSGTIQKTTAATYGDYPTLDLVTRPTAQSGPTQVPGTTDIGTYIFIGNNLGYIDSQRAAVVIAPAVFADAYHNGPKNDTAAFHLRGGRLHPNNGDSYVVAGVPYQVGDPRASADPINFSGFTDASSAASTHFKTWRSSADRQSLHQPGQVTTLGRLNSGLSPFSSAPKNRWLDAGARTSSSVANIVVTHVANSSIKSIGELGYVYDPAHISSPGTSTAAGGGRSLRIGRTEKSLFTGDSTAQWDGTYNSLSYRRSAWRLCDVFSTRDETNSGYENITPGLFNPNGALRDSGSSLLALLEGFRFMPTNTVVDSSFPNKTLANSDTSALVSSLIARLSQINPSSPSVFFERGEFGELDFFNTASIAGVSDPNDATREELFRRLVEMLTMKGNTFTVYTIGQCLTQLPNGELKPIATSTRKTTFRLQPSYSSSNLTFDPSNSVSVGNRFSSPTNYAISIISSTEN